MKFRVMSWNSPSRPTYHLCHVGALKVSVAVSVILQILAVLGGREGVLKVSVEVLVILRAYLRFLSWRWLC